MNDEKNQGDANNRRVSLRNLYLDPNNYRIIHENEQIHVPDEQVKDKTVARRIFHLLAGEHNQHIQNLIESFCSDLVGAQGPIYPNLKTDHQDRSRA